MPPPSGAPEKRLAAAISRLVGTDSWRLRLWDGVEVAPAGEVGFTVTLNSPRALDVLLGGTPERAFGRAYVAGLIDIEPLDAFLEGEARTPLSRMARAWPGIMAAALRMGGRPHRGHADGAEARLRGRMHSRARDAAAVRHHYDLPADFYELWLDESMTYSCAIFSRGATTLEEAQECKLDLVCTKLGLEEGQRVLDVGCGWGSFALHAARNYGVSVVGITLSPPQAETARRRAAEAGLADKIDIRVQDWRELPPGDTFDAISSIGMVEHVGEESIDAYAARLRELLNPETGRLLNHGIARVDPGDPTGGPFTQHYVFPDGAPLQLSRMLLAFERAGLVSDHIEGFAPDYAETLRHWYTRLDEHLDEATRLAGEERIRVWRLYLRAARWGFLNDFTSIYQVRARPEGSAFLAPLAARSAAVAA